MKKGISIHSLDSLEKEIYRLQLEAAAKEKQLSENISWLRHNARQVIVDELFCRSRKSNGKAEYSHTGSFTGERWKAFFDRIADHFTDRAADGIGDLFERLFQRKKKHN